MHAIGGNGQGAEQLDVGTEDRPGEVVLGGRPVSGPVDEEPGPGRGRRILLARPSVVGELFRSRFGGEPKDGGDGGIQAPGVTVQMAREGILGV
jgi:hypothetical protein